MDTGESTKETVKTIARGMPVIRLHLWRLRSCALSHRTRGRGCWLKHPAFPAPSVFRGTFDGTTRTRQRRGNAESYPATAHSLYPPLEGESRSAFERSETRTGVG